MADVSVATVAAAQKLGRAGVAWLQRVEEAGAMHGTHLLDLIVECGPSFARNDTTAAARDFLETMESAGVIRRGRFCPSPSQAAWAGFTGAQSDNSFKCECWSWHAGPNL